MSTGWAKLETHVVNGVFPLQRCIGSSDRSGVFLTQSAKFSSPTLALKLVRFATSGTAGAQLSRWRAAADLSHPHLIRIFESGECQVDGEHYLYVLMEYAEENLAQLLQRRALEEHEAREMLVPTLDALVYLHGRRLVQGQLKPPSLLVVQDQLKLASDSVCAVGEAPLGESGSSEYDAPEARDGSYSTAADVWALGVTLCEAFARRPPSGLHESGEVELPANVPAAFREIVARCLNRDPKDRPQVSQLQSWVRGESDLAARATPATSAAGAASDQRPAVSESQTASVAAPTSPSAPASTIRLVIRAQILPEEEPEVEIQQGARWRVVPLILAALVLVVLGWVGYRVFRGEPSAIAEQEVRPDVESQSPKLPAAPGEPTSPVGAEARRVPADSVAAAGASSAASAEPGSAGPAEPRAAAASPVGAESSATPGATTLPLNEVIPNVPRSALQTIRGTVRVSVRVIVDKDGAVLAATPEDPGPSRYFERLSLDASKKWTFPPVAAKEQRLMLVRFNYTRAGATASSKPVE